MIFFLISLIFSKESNLFILYVRPKSSPLELYSPQIIPICYTQKNPQDLRCFLEYDLFNINKINSSNFWCFMNNSNNIKSELTFFLKKNYQFVFSFGKTKAIENIGPNNDEIYTKFLFYLKKNQNHYQLSQVKGTDSKNISNNSFNFSYSFIEIINDINLKNSKQLYNIFLIILIFLIIFLFFIIKPIFNHHNLIGVFSIIPGNSFLLVILCGAGIDILFFLIFEIILNLLYPINNFSWFLIFTFSSIFSSFFTSIVTSLLSSYWRLKDTPSALYFSPLLIPIVILTIIFSVQWIPICIGSCINIPLDVLFYFIISVIFIKLPVNLISSLIFKYFYHPINFGFLINLNVLKFPWNRKVFLSLANIILFIILFPALNLLQTKFMYDINFNELNQIFIFIPLWILGSICIGIFSLSLGNSEDWAMFAFLSAAGSGLVFWIILFFNSVFIDKMISTLQLSMHSAISGIICICLSLSGGSISVLSALFWIRKNGIPSKKI